MSVAVAVQVIIFPIACGDLSEGVMDTNCMVAEAGTDNAPSIPMRHRDFVLEILMKVGPPLWQSNIGWLASLAAARFMPRLPNAVIL